MPMSVHFQFPERVYCFPLVFLCLQSPSVSCLDMLKCVDQEELLRSPCPCFDPCALLLLLLSASPGVSFWFARESGAQLTATEWRGVEWMTTHTRHTYRNTDTQREKNKRIEDYQHEYESWSWSWNCCYQITARCFQKNRVEGTGGRRRRARSAIDWVHCDAHLRPVLDAR